MPELNVESVGDLLDTIPYSPENEGKMSSRQKIDPKTEDTKEPSSKKKIPLPTLENAKKKQAEITKTSGNFSEDYPVDNFKSASPVKAKLSKLKDETPEKRAEIGAKFGAGMGLATSGPHGAIIGAAVGGMAGRSLGMLQSGEHEQSVRRDRIVDSLKELKIADKNGKVTFEDGTSIEVKNDPSIKLKNVSAIMSGEKDRPFHKVDKSHPMANRTATVARPIARYLAQSVLGFADPENPRDAEAIDATTGILINLFQEKAKSIDQVYARAKEFVTKLKCNEAHMRGFFDTIKSTINEKEAMDIKKGLDILYA